MNLSFLDCKWRRRKCERENESESCQRCINTGRECVPLEQQSGSEGTIYADDSDLSAMYNQVEELENQLEIFEHELNEQKQIAKQEPQWIITNVNGELRLTSRIRSFEEFMLYGHSVMRYLSPFGNVFGHTKLEFKQDHPSFVQVAASLIMKYQRSYVKNDKLLTNEVFNDSAKRKRLQLIMEILIDNYFRCNNDFCPILHEVSYREHFNSLKDPLADATTLAICASSAISGCKHSIFNMNEKRYLGEFFFQKCMNILLEIFDDSDRALESLVTINVLQFYMMSSGRFKESRKWASIAVLLVRGLALENEGFDKGGDHLSPKMRIKYAILHRNSFHSVILLTSLDYLLEKKQEDVVHTRVHLDTLPDEPQMSKDFIEMANYMLELVLHPTFVAVMIQSRKLSGGDLAELCLEDIVRYEEMMKDWWHRLPDDLKICRDPFELTPDIIQSTEDIRKLLLMFFVAVTSIGMQGVLLQPKSDKDTLNLHSILKGKATRLVMQLIENCLEMTKRMDQLDALCYCKTFNCAMYF